MTREILPIIFKVQSILDDQSLWNLFLKLKSLTFEEKVQNLDTTHNVLHYFPQFLACVHFFFKSVSNW